MQHVLRAYRYNLESARSHFQIKISGICVHAGIGLIDAENRLHGLVAATTYHIGENICEHGEILMTSRVVDHIADQFCIP